jgi:hypothetical protein
MTAARRREDRQGNRAEQEGRGHEALGPQLGPGQRWDLRLRPSASAGIDQASSGATQPKALESVGRLRARRLLTANPLRDGDAKLEVSCERDSSAASLSSKASRTKVR